MGKSVPSAFRQARTRTAGPGPEWQRATLTDITPLDPDEQAGATATSFTVTATTQDETTLQWTVALPPSMAEDAVFARYAAAAPDDSSLAGETVWVRERSSSESVPDDNPYWDTTGQWLLESLASQRQRQGLVNRWGRGLSTTLVALDALIGRWLLLLEVGGLIALAVLIEPAWVIVLTGMLLIACQEVALTVF